MRRFFVDLVVKLGGFVRNCYLCGMKRRKLLLVLAAALVLCGCGTTSRVQRRQAHPDAGVNPIALSAQGDQVAQPKVSKPAKDEARSQLSPLQQGLAALVADTLFESTQLGLSIVDLTTGEQLFSHGARQRMRPASSEKVVTAIAALDLLGPNYPLRTTLSTTGAVDGNVLRGDLYVRGGMDPLLSVADVRSLVNQLRAAGVRSITGRLVTDASLKDADEFGWGWCWDDENPTLSPLLCGGKPTLVSQLQAALKAAGIRVGAVSVGTTPASARTLAVVSRPLTAVLQPMMKQSDNLCAESVFYQMGRTRKQVAARIQDLLIRAYGGQAADGSTIADGSGLSLYNYQTPEAFTRLLTYAAQRPDSICTPLLAALPIAAVDGTLKSRMAGTPAAQNVRAKTGSVSAVSTLVGYTTQRSTGHLIAFAIMNQGVRRMAEGRDFQDRVCVLLSQ